MQVAQGRAADDGTIHFRQALASRLQPTSHAANDSLDGFHSDGKLAGDGIDRSPLNCHPAIDGLIALARRTLLFFRHSALLLLVGWVKRVKRAQAHHEPASN